MKSWIKIQQQLYNLDEFTVIDEPFYVKNGNGIPGYWQIVYATKINAGGSWTFNSELECKATFQEIERILTNRHRFLE